MTVIGERACADTDTHMLINMCIIVLSSPQIYINARTRRMSTYYMAILFIAGS